MFNLFKTYQKEILELANSLAGQSWLGIPREKVVKLTPNSYHLLKDKSTIQATFFTYDKFARLMDRGLTCLDLASEYKLQNGALAYYQGLGKDLGFPRVYLASGDAIYPTEDASIYCADDATWSNCYGATTGTIDAGPTPYLWARLIAPNYNIQRNFQTYNTSSIGATNTITAATSSLFGVGKGGTEAHSYNVYNSTHTVPLATADFNNGGTTAWATAITQTNISGTDYNDWTWNATGLAGISKTANTLFCYREATCDVANVAPANNNTYFNFYSSAQAGTANDPKLTVTYSLPAGGMLLFF